MKKELQRHHNSNIIPDGVDLRTLTRSTLRKNPIDIMFTDGTEKATVAKKVEVVPEFAALTEQIVKKRFEDKQEQEAIMRNLDSMVEIWTPPVEGNVSSFVEDETPEEKPVDKKKAKATKKTKVEKKKKTVKPAKKKTRKLPVEFKADKKLGIEVEFISDIVIEENE